MWYTHDVYTAAVPKLCRRHMLLTELAAAPGRALLACLWAFNHHAAQRYRSSTAPSPVAEDLDFDGKKKALGQLSLGRRAWGRQYA